MNQPKNRADRERHEQNKLSLHPLSIEDALRGAMATGKPPEPDSKRAKRTAATKLRIKREDRESDA